MPDAAATTNSSVGPLASRPQRARRSPGPASRWRDLAARILPRGRHLPDEVWQHRHNGLMILLWLQFVGLFLFALYRGYSTIHALGACAAIAVAGAVALVPGWSRPVRSASVAIGLLLACSILVYLSGGAIEAHFSYFVVIAFLTLYQEWMPFLIAILFVLLEHGIVGVIYPRAVYDHPGMAGMAGMDQDPWRWAFIHAGFVLAASFANLLAWRLTEHEALHDGLTGLPNRVLFLDSVQAACDARPGNTATVLFIDLDNFKDANDGFGHDIGDQLLRAIAARLGGTARAGDVLGRLGGDEFGVVLYDIRTPDEAFAAAQRYLDVFTDPFELTGMSLITSASIGLVLGDGDSRDAVELMRDADLAMYDAKRSGGGQISQYERHMRDATVHRANLEAELRAAVERHEFVVYYQPLVDVHSGQIVGNEALVRWQHPTRGLVPPAEFIPIAEQTGLIIALGEWVLRTACRQTVAWHVAYPDQRPLTISVNLSPRQLAEKSLIGTVADALAESGLGPQHLCLEITESALINDFDAALPKLKALRAIGISLALDDFGTGYSSLSYLRHLPVTSLKIDQSFISDLTSSGDHRIVLAIIELAHVMGMSVTAEGVETQEQLDLLREMSGNLAQGYLLGRPMPDKKISELLDGREPRTAKNSNPPRPSHR